MATLPVEQMNDFLERLPAEQMNYFVERLPAEQQILTIGIGKQQTLISAVSRLADARFNIRRLPASTFSGCPLHYSADARFKFQRLPASTFRGCPLQHSAVRRS